MAYLTEPFASHHNKKSFSCGKGLLDKYLHRQAGQDMKRRLSVVFVFPGEIVADNKAEIKGYYSLSNDSIPYDDVPEEVRKKMPSSYKSLPTTLLGRLAVDQSNQGQGIGELLLLDALRRSYDISNTEIGSIAVVVDPLDHAAIAFYQQYGFIELPDRGRMFLPMKTIGHLF